MKLVRSISSKHIEKFILELIMKNLVQLCIKIQINILFNLFNEKNNL